MLSSDAYTCPCPSFVFILILCSLFFVRCSCLCSLLCCCCCCACCDVVCPLPPSSVNSTLCFQLRMYVPVAVNQNVTTQATTTQERNGTDTTTKLEWGGGRGQQEHQGARRDKRKDRRGEARCGMQNMLCLLLIGSYERASHLRNYSCSLVVVVVVGLLLACLVLCPFRALPSILCPRCSYFCSCRCVASFSFSFPSLFCCCLLPSVLCLVSSFLCCVVFYLTIFLSFL